MGRPGAYYGLADAFAEEDGCLASTSATGLPDRREPGRRFGQRRDPNEQFEPKLGRLHFG